MRLGIVLCTYNRLDNLKLVLASLAKQTPGDFFVVIADDGSTDGTRLEVERLAKTRFWRKRLRWVGCGPNQRQRLSRARNIGAANLPEDVTHLLTLDSDFLLPKFVLDRFLKLHREYPTAVLSGMVGWLPPLSLNELESIWRSQGIESLQKLVPPPPLQLVRGTLVGMEHRDLSWFKDSRTAQPEPYQWQWYSSFTAYPVQVFWELGGFDEQMTGYGFEDVEFAIRLEQNGIQAILISDIWALHIWHPKAPSPASSPTIRKTSPICCRNTRLTLIIVTMSIGAIGITTTALLGVHYCSLEAISMSSTVYAPHVCYCQTKIGYIYLAFERKIFST
jgi:glycosyltransferase involved in cell wall biosynthesis